MLRIIIIITVMFLLIKAIHYFDNYQRRKNNKLNRYSSTPKQLDLYSKEQNTSAWNKELLMALEWKRYEEVCAYWLKLNNQLAQLTNIGADGGIDIKIQNNKGKIIAIAQCKAWQNKVDVSAVREFYGVMASEQIKQGYYFTTSDFTESARLFSQGKNIELINGQALLKAIQTLPKAHQQELYQFAIQGDYTTPTCPRCDCKMIKRHSEKGEFWGCRHYPKCKATLTVRKPTNYSISS